MKNIIWFDTSIATMNHGDDIINDSFQRNAAEILSGNYVIKYPTHAPCFLPYQQIQRNKRFAFVSNADYKFICGTNIINNHMISPWPFWNINLFNSSCYKNAVFVGAGVSGFTKNDKMSLYSRILFRKILSKEFVHSVRDDRTKNILESIGLKAINTGCPTIWGLTDSFCESIPTKKSNAVVLTLTDYQVNKETDQKLIDILLGKYEMVYFWPQGTLDYSYFGSLQHTETINIISPDITSLSTVYNSGVDYVGTRLHAGIYAMQHKVRSIILSVDNRARDMADSYGINVVDRSNTEEIEHMINSEFATNVRINKKNIQIWKSQFM